MKKEAITFQEIIRRLQSFWSEQGCMLWMPYHEAVGAGTMNPATVLRVLGPEPWNVAYVEPSFRADDGRFAENPNRVQMHHQFQVILQPGPSDPTGVYLKSLEALGLNLAEHDIRFVEDNWESPALGAWGLGWEVWLDGMEITQFTYFQQSGGVVLDPPAVELTYGLERIAMYLQDVDSIWDIQWDTAQSYGDILRTQEIEYCEYNFNVADIDRLKALYSNYVHEAKECLAKDIVVPAHDYVLKCSHTFNILDARGAIGLAERVKYFGEMRGLARKVSEAFLKQRESAGFPLLAKMPTVAPVTVPRAEKTSGTPETFLLEIGAEELAAESIPSLLQQLQDGVTSMLAAERLSHDTVRAYATPRRLVFIVETLQARQEDRTVEVRGPRRDVCEKNQQALLGFCRKNNVEPPAVTYATHEGVEYALVRRHEKGQDSLAVLAQKLPAVIQTFRAERTMRWLSSAQHGKTANTAFNRPIRWITALLGSNVVPFQFAGVVSGRTTLGGRWNGSPEVTIERAASYEAVMNTSHVVLNHEERRKLIASLVAQAAQSYGGTAIINERVLDEVTQLVEYPTAIIGSFAEQFRSLPRVVLVGTMEKHLRFFPVSDSKGTIVAFVAVRNGGPDTNDIVRRGYERVIGARFSDAAFFVGRDRQHRLETFRERIKTLTFVEGAGSMYDKCERLQKLLPRVAQQVSFGAIPATEMTRAAALAKADLGSQMVIEMSRLQGKIGRIYAEENGEPASVALALEEQYLPAFATDAIPSSPLGKLLALSDRLDTIAALFMNGAEPTGSADPFGIRRESLAVLSLLLGTGASVSLRQCFRIAMEILGQQSADEVLERILSFMNKRLEVALRERGYEYDVVRAVLARQSDNPAKAEALVKELGMALKDPAGREGIVACLRCARIVDHARQSGITVVRGIHLSSSAPAEEQALCTHVQSVIGRTTDSLGDGLQIVNSLAPFIHGYFDAVMVMSGEANERDRRLALLNEIVGIIDPLVDLRVLTAIE